MCLLWHGSITKASFSNPLGSQPKELTETLKKWWGGAGEQARGRAEGQVNRSTTWRRRGLHPQSCLRPQGCGPSVRRRVCAPGVKLWKVVMRSPVRDVNKQLKTHGLGTLWNAKLGEIKDVQCEEVKRLDQNGGCENREVKLRVTLGDHSTLGISWKHNKAIEWKYLCRYYPRRGGFDLRHFKLEKKLWLVVGNKPD